MNLKGFIHKLTLELRKRRINLDALNQVGGRFTASIRHMHIEPETAQLSIPSSWPRIGLLKTWENNAGVYIELYFDGDPPLTPYVVDPTKLSQRSDYFLNSDDKTEANLNVILHEVTQMAYEHAVAHNPMGSDNKGMPKFVNPELNIPYRIEFLDACILGMNNDPELESEGESPRMPRLFLEDDPQEFIKDSTVKFGNRPRKLD